MHIAHLNICSIVPKFYRFKDHLLNSNFDIFGITETWLNDNIPSELIKVDGFNLVRVDRPSRGGGVAFFLRDNIKYEIINTVHEIEQLWILVKYNNMNFAFGVFYKPPKMKYKQFVDVLEETINVIMQTTDDIYCFGDVNIDFLKVDDPATTYFLNMIKTLNLFQVVMQATHTTKTSASLIDVIFTSDSTIIAKVKELDFSNHDMISFNVNILPIKNESFFYTFRDWRHLNKTNFNNDLMNLNLENIFYINDVDDKVNYLNEKLTLLLDVHCPLKTVRITKAYSPWLTDNIKLLMKLRDKAKAKFKKEKSSGNWDYYKQLRNYTNHAIENEKKAYFIHISKNCYSRDLWKNLKLLNIKNHKKVSIPEHLKNVDNINNYFIDNIPDLQHVDADLINYYLHNSTTNSHFAFNLICNTDLLEVIIQVKSNAVGNDGLCIEFIKLCCPYIIKFLVNIFNTMFLEAKFPSSWKDSLVIPLPKITNPRDYNDLRPINILSCLSKIAEKIMEKQLRKFIDSNKILPDVQSGFRPGYSCTTALLNVTDDIIRAADKNQLTVLVLLDFSKAFDTVNHEILIAVLRSIGLGDRGIQLFRSYLAGRSQRVKLQNNISQYRTINQGVPQGSVLGPLLFSLYTGSFPKFLNQSNIHMYADDTQIYYSFSKENSELIHCLNDDLENLYKTSKQHNLLLNPSKSSVLLFGNKNDKITYRNSLQIKIGDQQIPINEKAKSLGVILDNTLRYRDQILKCIQRSYAALKLLYPHRNSLTVATKKILCDTLVLSQFNYCSALYGPSLDVDFANRIQRVQNSCLRFIFGIRKYDHISHKLIDIKWLNMNNRRKLHALCLYHKIIIYKKPPYLYEKITFRTDVHNINVRNKGSISPPSHKTVFFLRDVSLSTFIGSTTLYLMSYKYIHQLSLKRV